MVASELSQLCLQGIDVTNQRFCLLQFGGCGALLQLGLPKPVLQVFRAGSQRCVLMLVVLQNLLFLKELVL